MKEELPYAGVVHLKTNHFAMVIHSHIGFKD